MGLYKYQKGDFTSSAVTLYQKSILDFKCQLCQGWGGESQFFAFKTGTSLAGLSDMHKKCGKTCVESAVCQCQLDEDGWQGLF